MPHCDGFEAASQRLDIEGAAESETEREVVQPTLRFQLGQEPEPLLCKGQGSRTLPVRCRQGRNLPAVSFRTNPIDGPSQILNGRTFEGRAQRKLDLKGTPDAGDHLGGQERMSPQLEKMVPHPDPFEAENVRPDAGQQFFRHGARRLVV